MARWRKVEVSTWTDDRFLSLSQAQPNGQTLWLYLLCGPRTTPFPGLVVARPEVIASDLGWFQEGSLKGFWEAYRELSAQGLVKEDWKAGLVVLRKALFDSSGDPRESAAPSNPNQLKGWATSWELVPECDLAFEYLQQLELFAQALGQTFLEGFRKAFAKPLAKGLARPSPTQEAGIRTQEAGSRNEKNSAPPSVGGLPSEFRLEPAAKPERKRKPKPSEPTPDERAAAMLVLGKLSERNGVRYTGTAEHVRLIVAQLRKGVTSDDMRKIIGYCAIELEWAENEMVKYLRPETLFGPQTIAKYLDPARTWFEANGMTLANVREHLEAS